MEQNTTEMLRVNPKDVFAQQKFIVVRNAIPVEMARTFAQYAMFEYLHNFTKDDKQVPGSHTQYGNLLTEALLLELHSRVEEVTGLRLHPTYSLYRFYRPGDVLHPHTDRYACEISLSINFGYLYTDVDSDYNWPLQVDGKDIVLEPGDMVVYKGLELVHGRRPFDAGGASWQAQAFLHYVDADGPHADWKYDCRDAIGMPKSTKDIEDIRAENRTKVTYTS